MSLTIDMDLALLSHQIQRAVKEIGADTSAETKRQARLLTETFIRITPPHSLKQGRAAIKRDGRKKGARPCRRIEDHQQEFQEGAAIGRHRRSAILPRIQTGPLRGFTATGFSKDLHTSKRNRRGRVTKSQCIISLPLRQTKQYLKNNAIPLRPSQGRLVASPARHRGPSGRMDRAPRRKVRRRWRCCPWSGRDGSLAANRVVPATPGASIEITLKPRGKTDAPALVRYIGFSNLVDGRVIVLKLTTTGNFQPTWPAGIEWQGGILPIHPPSSKMVYQFFRVDGAVIAFAVPIALPA